jgi:alkylation response protein AidB-like acyl-CoA dehydrogenase
VSDLLYSETEEALRGSVRTLLADRAGSAAVLARVESGEPVDTKLWKALSADLGVVGLPVPEESGGEGASFRETAVVIEELGRAVAPVPYFGHAVLATSALLTCPGDLLRDVATGARTAALAVPFSAYSYAASVSAGPGGVLTGRVTSVVDASIADVLLVPAGDGGLYAVDASAAGRSLVTSLDLTRPLVDITLDGVPGERIGDAAPAVESALQTGAALLASEQLGTAEWCLETTVAYVKTRYQFGRPVGSFQALKHRLADLWVEVTQARALARYAVVCLATGDADLAVATSLAKAHCSATAVLAAEECVQLHGGIGFTWEHPAHLYLKRAKSTAIALGSPDRHRAQLAALVDLPA